MTAAPLTRAEATRLTRLAHARRAAQRDRVSTAADSKAARFLATDTPRASHNSGPGLPVTALLQAQLRDKV